MCSFVTQHNATDVLRECAIGMLTAGMSTSAVARELNVHFFNISGLQHHVWNLTFPYMNCNSVKTLKLLHVVFLFLFSVHYKYLKGF